MKTHIHFFASRPRADVLDRKCSVHPHPIPDLGSLRFSAVLSRAIVTMTVILAVWASTTGGFAQSYSISWSTIAGGGGTSSNAQFTASGTIGQAMASGSPSGVTNSVSSGFWTIYGVATPGAPLLHILLTTTNSARVSWPSPSTGFSLQVTTSLTSGSWTTPPEGVTDDGTQKFIVVNPTAGNRFYRLSKP